MAAERVQGPPWLDPGGVQVHALRDAYLEPWTRFAPPGELRRIFAAAYQLGMVGRALTWHAIYGAARPEAVELDEDRSRVWLELFASAATEGVRLGGR
jgi:hypothetical protein